jgi:hypothetical protein
MFSSPSLGKNAYYIAAKSRVFIAFRLVGQNNSARRSKEARNKREKEMERWDTSIPLLKL